MERRGPDGSGEWISPEGDVGLGHRRLAIIDLSDSGAQPMSWAEGRYQIVHNGEIYNYAELRETLSGQGVSFRSTSDTEVLLALYEREGPGLLRFVRGMYAFAIWDCHERRLFLARDPYGIKPLYYAFDGRYFRFASQVKALEASGAVPMDVDPGGLAGFMIWGSVPEPLTIRKGIRGLPAGHYLEVAGESVGEPNAFEDVSSPATESARSIGGAAAAIEASVRYHLVADVPVGAFLSSGIDSAVVAALAARVLQEPLTTLTIRFEAYRGTENDEGPLAAEVARCLGASHIEHTVGRREFIDLWPEAIAAMDQPSIDGFNTFLVSRIAQIHGLKVVLSGLGGDELFGSYPSFRDVPRWRRFGRYWSRLPGSLALSRVLAAALPGRPKLKGLARYGGSYPGAYLLRRGLYLPEELPSLMGEDLAGLGLEAYDPLQDIEKSVQSGGREASQDAWTLVHLMESTQYLRNQLLRDSDWASMAHSLELRVPFVDASLHKHFAASCFEEARTTTKAAFLRSVAAELPEAVWSRPKSGFSVPVQDFWETDQLPRSASKRPLGMDARRLALRVLREFGVDLPTAP